MLKQVSRLYRDESGQDLVEYAILLALLVVVVIVALKLFGPAIGNAFNDVAGDMPQG